MIIKIENKNLNKITNEIQNSQDLNIQQKTTLVGFINKTTQLIPLLTNDNLMEMDTKTKIKEMTDELRLLSSNFKKKDYPFETEQELNERLKAVSEEGGWGITKINAGSGSIENTLEVGDTVIVPKFGAQIVVVENETYIMASENDILGIIKNKENE